MDYPARITLTKDNVDRFPSFKRLLDEGKVIVDATGRLRYPHGAPVGELVLTKTLKDGSPRYKESAEEWFDPDSPKAKTFVWPS
jgi:hypothetical protein